MSITAAAPATSPQVTAAVSGRSYEYGSLSKQQLDTLRAVAGYDFNWPPTPGSGTFPLAAVFVANHMNLSNPFMAQQPLTVDSLKALATAGLIDAAGLARGVAFLRGDQTAVRADGSSAAWRPAPGTVAPDGSMYL